jgi:hypothetical protein
MSNNLVNGKANPELEALKKVSEMHIIPAPCDYDVVEVYIDLESKVMKAYVAELHAQLDVKVSLMGGQMPVTYEELYDYCKTLIAIRVQTVRKEPNMLRSAVRLGIPSYLFVVIDNLGVAVDRKLGVELTPAKIEPTLPVEKMVDISRKLNQLAVYGYEYTESFPRGDYGSWDFMAMTVIEGFVKRHSDEAHPVYALLASTLGLKGVEAALSPRCHYGLEEHLASVVRGLASLKGGS